MTQNREYKTVQMSKIFYFKTKTESRKPLDLQYVSVYLSGYRPDTKEFPNAIMQSIT